MESSRSDDSAEEWLRVLEEWLDLSPEEREKKREEEKKKEREELVKKIKVTRQRVEAPPAPPRGQSEEPPPPLPRSFGAPPPTSARIAPPAPSRGQSGEAPPLPPRSFGVPPPTSARIAPPAPSRGQSRGPPPPPPPSRGAPPPPTPARIAPPAPSRRQSRGRPPPPRPSRRPPPPPSARIEGKKENASRHGKHPPPPPVVGGNVNIGKGTSLQANGKNNFSNVSHSPSQTSLAQENRFIGHIGWDPQAGFDVDRLDDKWKELFSLVGVTAEQMQRKEAMDFIYDFVEKRGGIDNVRREIEKEKATEPQERKRREEEMRRRKKEKRKRREEEMRRRKEVPLEIHARGPVAVKAYNDALKDGEASVNRIPVILVGQERTGKTSLKRSLKGELFNKFEESTDGIQADTGYFKVSKEIWKTGKKIEDAGPESSISFENLAAAKLILERLRRENLSSQDVPQQSKNATHLDTEKTSRDTASSTSSQPNGNDDSPLHMPEIPEEVLHELTKLLQRERDVSDTNDVYSILWDFAGQSVYYDTHPIFLIENAIYLLVANLSHNPEEKATPPVKKGLYSNVVDSHSNKTNLDFLDFWMSSIFSLASPQSSCSDSATNGQENLPGRLPPVFLVCTHADKPFYRTKARDQALEIYGFLRSKAYREHLFKDVFAVDNTKSGGDHECLEVVRLREKVLAVAKEFPLMKTKIPLRWLKYENLLHIRMEHDKWIPLNEARCIAFDECIIHNEAEFSTLLNFLHDQRIVVHFSGSPELERMVILDPQWLVDVLKKIITVKRYEHSEKQVESMWLKLEDTGVLDERLIDHAWRDLFDNQESRDSLIAILERLSLLCSWPSADSNKQYLVPSMLMSPPTKDVLRLLASAKMPSLFITFASGRVPPGLFSRLILLFLQWCKEEWKSEVRPQLFHNFAVFYILPGQGVSLIFWCHSSSIEIVVYSGDIDNETVAKSSYENYDQTLGRTIHWKLRLVMECMRKEFHWLKYVNYDMCVCCPVCSQAGSIKCRAHDVYGCECLHFLSESDLRQRQYCDRPGRSLLGDCRIRVNQFECWFSFEHVEKSAGISTNRQPQAFNASGPESSFDEEGIFPLEGTTQKELPLPENAKSSIQSISFRSTSDVEDIVIQFQETLHLEPASLTSPEPETKSMIRGLALRAKSEKRDDLVRHLRKITPAGTTGPLLNEDLPIGCMPYKQYKDLTFSLSGGDEWKLLAERLGFSQIEIRFLDKRVMNPSDVVLGAVGKHRHLSVGEIYDTLVDCELPAVADLM